MDAVKILVECGFDVFTSNKKFSNLSHIVFEFMNNSEAFKFMMNNYFIRNRCDVNLIERFSLSDISLEMKFYLAKFIFHTSNVFNLYFYLITPMNYLGSISA